MVILSPTLRPSFSRVSSSGIGDWLRDEPELSPVVPVSRVEVVEMVDC